MLGIFLEQREIFTGYLLDVLRESLVVFPKRRQRMGAHGSGVKLPASISASIFSNAFACLPSGEKSSSISLSQASLSRRAMCAANFASSLGDNLSTASSISARLTLESMSEHKVI